MKTITPLLKRNLEEKIYSALQKQKTKQEAAYRARCKSAEEEIKKFLSETVNPEIYKILQRYELDTMVHKFGDLTLTPAPEAMLRFYVNYIQNLEEREQLEELYKTQIEESNKRLKAFYTECKSGCDSETYEKALHDLCIFGD